MKLFFLFILTICAVNVIAQNVDESSTDTVADTTENVPEDSDDVDDISDNDIFKEYTKKFRVHFRRRANFTEIRNNLFNRYRSVIRQNRRFARGLESFNRTLYPFSHLSEDEFSDNYLGANAPDPNEELPLVNETEITNRHGRLAEPPETAFEWPESIVGVVKSQGQCGSCYAFAAIGVIKSRMALKYGPNVFDLSEQDAMECSRGCVGGWDYSIYRDYTQVYNGSAAYNYMNIHSYTGIAYSCQATKRARVPNSKVRQYAYLQNNEKTIRTYLYNYGPLYTRFNVYSNFYDYSTGIYKYASGNYAGGHAVMLVGWGEENGVKYWKLKNSWDTWWGEKGYFRFLRGSNLCGIEGSVSVILDI
ncbi:gut-specific cysteine proteinase-like [Chironomus tepperi]|uniref:gut-specific cysteine proteinase-like n=1 Tax=Chironomus tepperi TaxID=113505 RepID=UPI00391FCA27